VEFLATDEEHLKEKARLLLQRERELFELRLKHEQLAVWLSVGQELPKLLLNRGALDEVWERVRRTLILKLRLQRVLLLEVHPEMLRPLAPATADRPLAAQASALLAAQSSGYCNDPQADSNPAGVSAVAEALGLHRFMWARIAREGEPALLLVGGFDRAKATFQSPFGENDAAHFNNAAQHLESLLANALLVQKLEREKEQLEQRDRSLQRLTEQLQTVNESLEQRVRERTQELAGRNRELRLVLDNIDQALLTVDLEGYVAPERSRVSDVWFGSHTGRHRFTEHLAADRQFIETFEFGLEALRDGLMPRELCLDQMPQRFEVAGRKLECRYLPLEKDGELEGLLLVIDDVTERVARAREEAEQRELLAAFMALMRDRTGFLCFFEESERIFSTLSQSHADRASEKRLLHTLKGNAASVGLEVIAELCHSAESELADERRVREATYDRLRARWTEIVRTMGAVLPVESRKTIEVREGELQSLRELALHGASGTEIVAAVQRLQWEPVERSLTRLAAHAQGLAERLEKEAIEVQIDTDGLRLEPEPWTALWSALIHVVRNAVDHGIESRKERELAGKPPAGRLRLAARRAKLGFRVEIGDDGRGIDWEAVRKQCEAQGRPNRSSADLLNAILSPDFSTRGHVTETSGRGIGLAAVAATVRELGGALMLESQLGAGAQLTLTFPSPVDAPIASELATGRGTRTDPIRKG
jgi:two-component system chemotaxis sensor kinase CheA